MKKALTRLSSIFFATILFTALQSHPITAKPHASITDTIQQSDANTSPENVMNTVFQVARTGDTALLKSLLPPFDEQRGMIPCDGDCLALCNPGNESMREALGHNYLTWEDYQHYFSKGKIIGVPQIDGESAKVFFLFGPDLERKETMNMQRINGKWYLTSF